MTYKRGDITSPKSEGAESDSEGEGESEVRDTQMQQVRERERQRQTDQQTNLVKDREAISTYNCTLKFQQNDCLILLAVH